MGELTLGRYGQALVDETALLAGTVRDVDGDAPVPTCPEWTLRELVGHVGQTQHWVASIVEQRVSDPSQLPASVPDLPADRGAWAAWLAEGASRLAAAGVEAGTDGAVWNPAGDGRSGTEFWLPRTLAETVIHRADAAATAGVPYELDAGTARAAIADHLAMMTSPGWAYQRPDSAQALRGNGQTLRLRATDAAGAGGWLIRRGTDAATWREDPAAAGGTVGGTADVTVSGPAAALLLVLTRRRPIAAAQAGGLQVSGDPDLFAHWVEHTAHQAG